MSSTTLRQIARKLFLAVAPPVTTQRLLMKSRYPKRNLPPNATGDGFTDSIIAEIADRGVAVIPDYLSPEECREAIADFERTCSTRPDRVHEAEDRRLYGLEAVSPVARRFHTDPLWIRIAENYTLEPQMVFCTMANRIDSDGSEKFGSGGCWHRDGFARELKVIVYLSDVSSENGPFQYICGSHRAVIDDMKTAGLGLLQHRIGNDPVTTLRKRGEGGDRDRLAELTAKAGTAIAFDDSGIHRGSPIRNGSRYALTNYTFAKAVVTPALRDLYAPMLEG